MGRQHLRVPQLTGSVAWTPIDARFIRDGKARTLRSVVFHFEGLPASIFPRREYPKGEFYLYIRKGTVWDGASFDALNQFAFAASSLAHDELFEKWFRLRGGNQAQADYCLALIQETEGMGSTGEGGWFARAGLRLFGRRAWRRETV